jgi:hypothetical protein
MRIYLPRDLFWQIHEDPAVNPASRRKVVLPRITRQILEAKGYAFGSKIRVPGGYAFEATAPDGRALKIGLKTAVNRWLNTATTLVERVDTVIVTTFKWDDEGEKPDALELIEISSTDLLAMIEKVRKAARKAGGDANGHNYMPIDDDELADYEHNFGCAAGSVLTVGRQIFGPEPVIWTADEWGRIEKEGGKPIAVPPSGPSPQPLDVTAIVAKTKDDLAAQLGIPASNIDLSIRF